MVLGIPVVKLAARSTNLPVLSGFSTPTASTLTSMSLGSAAAFSLLRLGDMVFGFRLAKCVCARGWDGARGHCIS